jgi:hypothetical protein
MPFLQGCNSARDSAERRSDSPCVPGDENCPVPAVLVSMSVVSGASRNENMPPKNWAVVKGDADDIIVQVNTNPNNQTTWGQVNWTGDQGALVPGHLNQRRFSRASSRRIHVEASLGGVSDHADVWVIWASIQVLTQGNVPPNSAQFQPGMRDETQRLGAVTYLTLFSTQYGNRDEDYIQNMGASGKVCLVATILPAGIHSVVSTGFTFRRERQTHAYYNGSRNGDYTDTWLNDTSPAFFLRLTPDANDKIYDLDAPDMRYSTHTSEVYHNMRQWIEWNNTRCSDNAFWYWEVFWRANRIQSSQIILNQLGIGSIPGGFPPEPRPAR